MPIDPKITATLFDNELNSTFEKLCWLDNGVNIDLKN